MEITGKIIKLLEAQSGTSTKGEWKKQEFIIETEGQYPKKICITNWNGKADLNNVSIGTKVKVGIDLESREYNERWYTTVKVWKFDILDNAGPAAEQKLPDNDDISDMLFEDKEEENDLPF
ncbi:DUF3127 domain-containing protein [Bacteroidota bacterium]